MGIGLIIAGIFILRNRERSLRWSQKHLRQNVGQLGEAVAEAGKPSHMIGPGIGAIFIGASYLIQAMTQAPTAEVTSGSSAGVVEGLNIGVLALGIVCIALGAHLLLGRERALGWSQKHFRQNVGQLREAFSGAGKPSHMIVPAISTILIGVLLVFLATT